MDARFRIMAIFFLLVGLYACAGVLVWIAALAGAYLSCAQLGLPALVDGFIASAAALVAVRHNPAVADWLFYSHASAEPGHAAMTLALEQYEVLLEEQAFPFEERAIDIHVANLRRGWSGAWDVGVDSSLGSLEQLMPARYLREEEGMDYASHLY